MAVITAPRFAKDLSPFMFSASLVGALAEAGVHGVSLKSAGAEALPPEMANAPLLLE
ncbi:MAG: hypothetical protein LC624_10450 [Halobacteriales archaeon]|nr:hypothetical protein [Halobacteriales archaeon]